MKLPEPNSGLNCNDGGGGTADCHDNAVSMSCCIPVGRVKSTKTDKKPNMRTVELRLADNPGGGSNVAFYERASIYIDWTSDKKLCVGAPLPAGSGASASAAQD